jgi:hypothetical protein
MNTITPIRIAVEQPDPGIARAKGEAVDDDVGAIGRR